MSSGSFRRSFRSLALAQTFDDPVQTQLLVLGMPRPSDIAPNEFPLHPGKRDVRNHKRNASTGKTFRFPSGDIFNSDVPRSSPPFHFTPSGSNGSLPSMDDRYYNMITNTTTATTTFPQNRRRHSIGAYFNRKGTNPAQIQEETSFTTHRMDEIDGDFNHKKEEFGGARKRCNCSTKDTKSGGMEDILIVSSKKSEAADLWDKYLKECIDQIRRKEKKSLFRIISVAIEDLFKPDVEALQDKLNKNCKLGIVILCPVFTQFVVENPEYGAKLSKYVKSTRILTMLLGVEESSVSDDLKSALTNYSQWRRMEAVKDRDTQFVGEFLGAAMEIISKSPSQQTKSDKCSFMLMPKKVNKNQNKVLVLLNDPITKEDQMTVTIIRNEESFEIPTVKRRNPYTLIFRMPEQFLTVSMLVSVCVKRNGIILDSKNMKCENQLYAMDQILRSCDNPVEFMCQALNIVPFDKDKLDDFLDASLRRNVPPNFNLLQTSGLGHLHRGVISKDEFPTLLHFAARFGLDKLCWTLLELPGGDLACEIRNICELTPAELAESGGHTKLANSLYGYTQMTELTSVYTLLKGMSDDKNDPSDDYLNPRPLSETYQVPPSPRPLAQACIQPPIGYMQMHSPARNKNKSLSDVQEEERNLTSLKLSNEKLKNRKSIESTKRDENSEQQSLKKSKENLGNGTQDELIEIINDFKNNVFTISEVEKLVENWKNRNDVRQSFREKQEQLAKMREEYERVQQQLKEEMKEVGRLSPMERIKNFFRGKTKESKNSGKKRQENSYSHRPASSLSIQSSCSSSSGRLSTGSHCSGTSLGDSGTHSDAESERKFRSNVNDCCSYRRNKDITENYDVPPSPVSLLSDRQKMSNGILNYDIPPSPVTNEFLSGLQLNTPPPSFVSCSCDSLQSNKEEYYYNIPNNKENLIPNESTLHNRLIRAGSKNYLKTVDEGIETKTDETFLEYTNLSVNGKVTAKCVVISDDEDDESQIDLRLPEYVNVETPEMAVSCK